MYYKNYNKSEIVRKICECANIYKDNLLNKNIMFIFKNKNKKSIDFIETLFLSQSFLHFTGLNYNKGSTEFFKECLSNRVLQENIKIKNKGFTDLKLKVLENAMYISKSVKRIGKKSLKKRTTKSSKFAQQNSQNLHNDIA